MSESTCSFCRRLPAVAEVRWRDRWRLACDAMATLARRQGFDVRTLKGKVAA